MKISFDFKILNKRYPHLTKMKSLLKNSVISRKFNNTTSLNELRKSVLSVCIYYNDFKYTVIRKNPKMNWTDLISSIGGIMGVFIGTSFMSFFEIIDVITAVSKILSKNRKIHPLNIREVKFTKNEID
jgi:hypothetical protein